MQLTRDVKVGAYPNLSFYPTLFIGGLFHPADDKQEVAFRYAVEKINADRTILPRSKLSAQIEKMSPQDSFHASKKGRSVRYKLSANAFFIINI